MLRKILVLAVLLVSVVCAYAQTGAIEGYCNRGGQSATVSGLNSSNKFQNIINSCTISIYQTGTNTLVPGNQIFSNSTGTVLGNPFTADNATSMTPGKWLFFISTATAVDVYGSGGIAPNTYPSPVPLCIDCFASSQFTPVVGLAALQTNGGNNTSQVLLNHVDTSTVKWSNPSGGVEEADVAVGNGLQMAVSPPGGVTQYVIVRPSSGSGTCPTGTTCTVGASSASLTWYCTGVFCNLVANTQASWVFTGSVLPAGVIAGNVTAVYAYSINSANSVVNDPIGTTFTCNGQNIKAGSSVWSQAQGTSGALSGITGSNFTGVTCTATLIAGGAPGPSGISMNVPDVGLIIAYTGSPATIPPAVYVATPLYYNPVLSKLGIDTSGSGTVGAGTAGQYARYLADGTSVSGQSSAAGSILVTDPPFNAKCDGVTDDYAAINAAFNSSATTIELPLAGFCSYGTGLVLPRGKTVVGNNAILDFTANNGIGFTSTGNNILVLFGVEVDGTGTVTSYAFGSDIQATDIYEFAGNPSAPPSVYTGAAFADTAGTLSSFATIGPIKITTVVAHQSPLIFNNLAITPNGNTIPTQKMIQFINLGSPVSINSAIIDMRNSTAGTDCVICADYSGNGEASINIQNMTVYTDVGFTGHVIDSAHSGGGLVPQIFGQILVEASAANFSTGTWTGSVNINGTQYRGSAATLTYRCNGGTQAGLIYTNNTSCTGGTAVATGDSVQ